MAEKRHALLVLTLNTTAFGVCFAAWTLNGVLVTFLVDQGVFMWNKAQMGLLIGIPILTGSILRLPLGVLTDKYGGKVVYTTLMLVSAVPMFLLGYASDFSEFLLASLGFGLTGASFAVGIAYTSVWFEKERQGTALGIFGIGNIGAAFTSLAAPSVLNRLTDGGQNLEAWRTLPKLYAAALVLMAVTFALLSKTRLAGGNADQTLLQRLLPLKYARVWRFGLYYFVVFGGFVALSQWLIPYYVSSYSMNIETAGLMASLFSLPSGLTRAVGGWLSDTFGPRTVMYWVFTLCLISFIFLFVPRMDIQTPGQAVLADKPGIVTSVSPTEVVVGEKKYAILPSVTRIEGLGEANVLVWPTFSFGQEPIVRTGEQVSRRQMLARGTTHIYFQANVWIFSGLVFLLAIAMGIGMGAVYKFIPEYFPREVGVVGGIVGVLGGLGGFFYPIIFGMFLGVTGIWTTNWMFLFLVTLIAFVWLHITVRKIMKVQAANLVRQLENSGTSS